MNGKLWDTQEIIYPDGGKLIIDIWMIDGKPHKTFKLPWGERMKEKPGYEADVMYKIYNGRDRSLHDVWQEIQRMIEPAD
jgi:hypothetical protein